MRQFEHREHLISVTVSRDNRGLRIETQIALPAEVRREVQNQLMDVDTDTVRAVASDDIENEACEAAKRVVNVLVAERAALGRNPR